MARRINSTCMACAQLSVVDARQLHGKSGDNCWIEKRCHRRRSHYRNRRELNEQRRVDYRQRVQSEQANGDVEHISLEVAESSLPYANLYIWREQRKNAPVHAIAATVIQNDQKVLEVVPIHCAGYRKRQLERYVGQTVMPYLKEHFGITHFANEIRLDPMECPLQDCPLKEKFEASRGTDG